MIPARILLPACLAGLLLAACGPDSRSQTAALREHDPALNEGDPCVKNLEHVIESLFLYYSAYHQLPESLEDARALSLTGKKFDLTCHRTQKPYIYVRNGLTVPASIMPSRMRLIVYDEVAAHPIRQPLSDGKDTYDYLRTVHYGIVMAPPAPAEPLQMFVVPLDDRLLSLYQGKPIPPK